VPLRRLLVGMRSCSTTSSREGAAASCRADRLAIFRKAARTEIVGIPQTLNGRVLRSMISSCRRKSSGCFFNSAIRGGGMGTVGLAAGPLHPIFERFVAAGFRRFLLA